MKLTGRDLVKLTEDTLFKMTVFQLKTEQGIIVNEIKSLIFLQFLIMSEATCYEFDIFRAFKVPVHLIPEYMLYIASGLTFIFAGMLTASLVMSSRMNVHAKVPLLITATGHMIHVFKKVIFGLNLWAFMNCLVNLDNAVVHLSVGLSAMVIGMLCMIFVDLVLRSALPSNGAAGCLEIRYSFFQSMLCQAIVILGVLGKYEKSRSIRLIYMISNIFLTSVQFLCQAYKPSFWNLPANTVFLYFYGAIFLFSIWNLPVFLSSTQSIRWVSLFLTLGFLPKIIQSITRWQENVDIFDPKETHYRKLRGLLIVTKLFYKSWNDKLSDEEEIELYRYKYQIRERGKRVGKSAQEIELSLKSCDRLAQVLGEEGEEYLKSYDMAKFEFLSRLMSPSDNILKAFISLVRFKQFLGEGLLARLEGRFFDMLFEARLQAFYYLRPEEKSTQQTTINDLFKNYIMNAEQNVSTKVADICLPLNQKTLFMKIREKIFRIIKNRNHIYKYILAKANSNSHMMSFDLFTYNQTERQQLIATKDLIKVEFKPIKLPPSYFFPSLFTMSALIQHDTLEARKILRTFKKNLQAWEYFKLREQTLRLDVLDVHAAVLQASLQATDRGRIVDATPNWPAMLGELDNGTIVGRNVNDLFIDMLSQRHAIMMANTFGLTRILNVKQDFYIKTFNHELKAVIFTLRLWPSLEKDLTGVIAIGPSGIHSLGQNMLLMRPNMDIIEAEEGFWSNIGQGDDGKEMYSVLQITVKLEIVNKLLSIYEGFIEEALTFHIQDEIDTPLEAIYHLGNVLLKLNQSCSLVYRVDENTNFTSNLKGTPMLCRITIVEFMDVILSQLFVRFGVRDSENPALLHKKQNTLETKIDSKMTRFVTSSANENANNTMEEFIKEEKNHYMENMTLKEKLKIWNEEEKPTEVDLILNEIFKWIGKADEADVRLCPTALKKYLIRFGDVVSQLSQTIDKKTTRSKNSNTKQITLNENSFVEKSDLHLEFDAKHSFKVINSPDLRQNQKLLHKNTPSSMKDGLFQSSKLLNLPIKNSTSISKEHQHHNSDQYSKDIVYMGELKEEAEELEISPKNENKKNIADSVLNFSGELSKNIKDENIKISSDIQVNKRSAKLGGSKSSKGSRKQKVVDINIEKQDQARYDELFEYGQR